MDAPAVSLGSHDDRLAQPLLVGLHERAVLTPAARAAHRRAACGRGGAAWAAHADLHRPRHHRRHGGGNRTEAAARTASAVPAHRGVWQEQRTLALPRHAHALGRDADQPVDGHRRQRRAQRGEEARAFQQPRRADERDGHRGARSARTARPDGGGRQLVHLGAASGPVQRARTETRHPRRRPGNLGHAGAGAAQRAHATGAPLRIAHRAAGGGEPLSEHHAQRQTGLADAGLESRRRLRRRHLGHRYDLARLANAPAWR
jgi:hypothetical protein